MIEYNKRLVEVDAILTELTEEELLKIPEEIRNLIKENKDKDYSWEYDKSKELKSQNVSRDTFEILAYLTTEYLLDEEQKKIVKQIYQINERKVEKEKSLAYKGKELFATDKVAANNKKEDFRKMVQENGDLIVKTKENFFVKFISKIKKD